jgi:hypothetical protein
VDSWQLAVEVVVTVYRVAADGVACGWVSVVAVAVAVDIHALPATVDGGNLEFERVSWRDYQGG